LGKLGHPDGEVVLTRAAFKENVIQMIPTLASCSLDEITAARQPNQTQFFQLYVNGDRTITERLVRKAEQRGCKALFITVDAPTLAKREKDMRMKYKERAPDVQNEASVDRNQGAARAIASFIDAGLCWNVS
jgi:L-lactate dehydrogenase (cytochrome)